MGKRQLTTIMDVAKKTGLSKTTISRYLNGKYEYMSAKSRSSITEAINELHYRPNKLARGLKSNHSYTLGVVISDITSPFSAILLKGINDACSKLGYGVLITSSDDTPSLEQKHIHSMLDHRVDGIILNTTGENVEFLKDLASTCSVPIVLADREVEPLLFDTVCAANRIATNEMLHYLKEHGYNRVALFSEPLENGTRVTRYRAYQGAYHEVFNQKPSTYILQKACIEKNMALLTQYMADYPGEKLAILTSNGVASLAVAKAMKRQGLRYPQDIGLCGFDNWDWMELAGAGLTVIDVPTYTIALECVRRLLQRIDQTEELLPQVAKLPCKLIIRSSV